MTYQPTDLACSEPFIGSPNSHVGTPLQERLPAIIDAIPGDEARAVQHQFTHYRQSLFLQRLADCGEVRVAARATNVSHQTVYRQRRACRHFRLAWDTALLIARDLAEDALATRAMHGVEEDVLYHGEVVAKRRRYDSRLLLAHLGRLDRLEKRADVAAMACAFDDMIAAFETADEGGVVMPEPEGVSVEAGTSGSGAQTEEVSAYAGTHAGEDKPSEPCNMRSMSRPERQVEEGLEVGDGSDGDDPADPPELERRLQAMETALAEVATAGAEGVGLRAGTVEEASAQEAAMLAAFEAGEPRWWEAGLDGLGEPPTQRGSCPEAPHPQTPSQRSSEHRSSS